MTANSPKASPEQAVAYLVRHGVNVELTDYGFRLLHSQFSDRVLADCGMDNDSSISLSVNTDESPPVIWFFRRNYREMAEFIVQAYAHSDAPSGLPSAIVCAMRELDKDYDNTALRRMTAAFLGELENDRDMTGNG